MVETTALSPHIGVQVTGVASLTDETTIATCLEALKWRGVLLHRALPYSVESQRTLHRTTVHGVEAFQ
jgi:hypothetical protein